MNINKMSKNAFNIANKLYDELGINYHDIEISVANHLDFIQKHKGWNDIIGGKRIIFWGGASLGGNLQMETPTGTWVLPHDLWEPDYIDIDVYLKNEEDLIRLVLNEIEHNRYELTSVNGNKALISKNCLWTATRNVLGMKNEDKWVELHDNAGHGYILDICAFKEAFNNK